MKVRLLVRLTGAVVGAVVGYAVWYVVTEWKKAGQPVPGYSAAREAEAFLRQQVTCTVPMCSVSPGPHLRQRGCPCP